MALDELIAGLKVFKEGVQDLAVGTAMSNANKQLEQLKSQQLDENDMFMAQNQISNELALRLGASGADAAKIQATAGRFGVDSATQFEGALREKLQNKQIASQEKMFDKSVLSAGANAQQEASLKIKQLTPSGMLVAPGEAPSEEDAKQATKIAVQAKEAIRLNTEIKELVASVPAGVAQYPGKTRAAMKSKIAQLRGILKSESFQNAGAALTPEEDEKLIQPLLADPTLIFQNPDTYLSQLDTFGNDATQKVLSGARQHKFILAPGGELEQTLVKGSASFESIQKVTNIVNKLEGKKLTPELQQALRYLKSGQVYQHLADPVMKNEIEARLKILNDGIR